MSRDEWYFRVGMRMRALTPIIDDADLDRLARLLYGVDVHRSLGHTPEVAALALCDLDIDTLRGMDIRPPHESRDTTDAPA